MASEKVTVIALMRAAAGREAELLKELESLIEPTRGEEGCINYDLHRNTENPAEFMFHENWRSREDLDIHLRKPYLQRFFGLAETLLDSPAQVTVWEEISRK